MGFEELQENKYAEKCEEVGRQLLMYLTRVIQIGIQDGSVAGLMEPKLLAVQIWSSVRGMMQLYQIRSQGHLQNMLEKFELDMEAMIRQLMDLLLNGIPKKHYYT